MSKGLSKLWSLTPWSSSKKKGQEEKQDNKFVFGGRFFLVFCCWFLFCTNLLFDDMFCSSVHGVSCFWWVWAFWSSWCSWQKLGGCRVNLQRVSPRSNPGGSNSGLWFDLTLVLLVVLLQPCCYHSALKSFAVCCFWLFLDGFGAVVGCFGELFLFLERFVRKPVYKKNKHITSSTSKHLHNCKFVLKGVVVFFSRCLCRCLRHCLSLSLSFSSPMSACLCLGCLSEHFASQIPPRSMYIEVQPLEPLEPALAAAATPRLDVTAGATYSLGRRLGSFRTGLSSAVTYRHLLSLTVTYRYLPSIIDRDLPHRQTCVLFKSNIYWTNITST